MPSLLQLRRARRDGLLLGWDTTSRGDMFAAWPMGCGHGTALLDVLHQRLPDALMTAVARDQRVAALYARYGLRPIFPGSLILTRQANHDRSAQASPTPHR